MEQVTDHILAAARKVIAVHINYPSRAAQRGRTPAQPSYFLKPSSSLAVGSAEAPSTVERPAGCELLGYEGEIALIIGKPARRVGIEDAWSHVEWVTASNDLGVYDLRYADKGSNLRSKGGDGFTPVGPGLIAADTVDPAKLRIRTWHNGELVQDDTTEDLLFPFARLVADLSQLLTLEEGDIILTGTPAGASVAKPGDVVEVEVSAAFVAPPPASPPAAWSPGWRKARRRSRTSAPGPRPMTSSGRKPTVPAKPPAFPGAGPAV